MAKAQISVLKVVEACETKLLMLARTPETPENSAERSKVKGLLDLSKAAEQAEYVSRWASESYMGPGWRSDHRPILTMEMNDIEFGIISDAWGISPHNYEREQGEIDSLRSSAVQMIENTLKVEYWPQWSEELRTVLLEVVADHLSKNEVEKTAKVCDRILGVYVNTGSAKVLGDLFRVWSKTVSSEIIEQKGLGWQRMNDMIQSGVFRDQVY